MEPRAVNSQGLFPDLKDGHDGCREGVKVCWGVVFKDEPVKKMGHVRTVWSLKSRAESSIYFIFFSQRKINPPLLRLAG